MFTGMSNLRIRRVDKFWYVCAVIHAGLTSVSSSAHVPVSLVFSSLL